MVENPSFRNRPEETTSALAIASNIRELNREIANIYSLRDNARKRFLSDSDWTKVKKLLTLKDNLTVNLLSENLQNPREDIRITIRKHPSEELHPFSMNQISIYVPLPNCPSEDYVIEAELLDLTKNGVIKNSLEAEKLLGESPVIIGENTYDFAYRTGLELEKIKQQIEISKDTNKNNFSAEELENLSANLIIDRLVSLTARDDLTFNYSLKFCMYENNKGEALSEGFTLSMGGRSFYYEFHGQRFKNVVNEMGGYDKIVTLIE